MSRIFTSLTTVFLLLALPFGALAQSEPTPASQLTAIITGPTDIAVGRTLVLDASSSTVPDVESLEYRWYRQGVPQPISESVEAVFTPEESGQTQITLEISYEIDGERVSSQAVQNITVYERKIVLIADSTVDPSKLRYHEQQAMEQNIFLRILRPMEAGIPLGEDGSLVSIISENAASFTNAYAVVIWSDGITGLQALLRAFEGDTDRIAQISNQSIVLLTNQGLDTIARTARGPFSVLDPQQIIVTRSEALNTLLLSDTILNFQTQIDQRDIGFEIVDESSVAVRPWNLFSSLVNYMLTSGVPSRTVMYLLMLPIIATIIAFLKQVVGITTFGLYTPSVIALSFLALGWSVGVSFLLFIIISGYATRSMMKRWRLLYIPKVAIIISVVSVTLLLLLGLGAAFDLILSGDTIFILLIMSTLSESLLNTKAEEGMASALFAVSETILAALLCVFIVQLSVLQSLLLAYPELILLTLVINVILGRWSGLRLVEYFRFREVFKHLQEE